jgi:hypothetical protein
MVPIEESLEGFITAAQMKELASNYNYSTAAYGDFIELNEHGEQIEPIRWQGEYRKWYVLDDPTAISEEVTRCVEAFENRREGRVTVLYSLDHLTVDFSAYNINNRHLSDRYKDSVRQELRDHGLKIVGGRIRKIVVKAKAVTTLVSGLLHVADRYVNNSLGNTKQPFIDFKHINVRENQIHIGVMLKQLGVTYEQIKNHGTNVLNWGFFQNDYTDEEIQSVEEWWNQLPENLSEIVVEEAES